MAEPLSTPPAADYVPSEPPKKNNTTLIVILVIVAVLVLCCCVIIAGMAIFGGPIIDELQYQFSSILPAFALQLV